MVTCRVLMTLEGSRAPRGTWQSLAEGPFPNTKQGNLLLFPHLACSLPHNTTYLLNPLTFPGTATIIINTESWSEVLAY